MVISVSTIGTVPLRHGTCTIALGWNRCFNEAHCFGSHHPESYSLALFHHSFTHSFKHLFIPSANAYRSLTTCQALSWVVSNCRPGSHSSYLMVLCFYAQESHPSYLVCTCLYALSVVSPTSTGHFWHLNPPFSSYKALYIHYDSIAPYNKPLRKWALLSVPNYRWECNFYFFSQTSPSSYLLGKSFLQGGSQHKGGESSPALHCGGGILTYCHWPCKCYHMILIIKL